MNHISNALLPARRYLAAMLAALIAVSSFAVQASATETAGQKSTRNLILAGLAATAAVILYNNYHHKYEAAHTVVGYTRDGGVVYADGRIVYPDGSTLYAGNRNGDRCTYDGQYAPCGNQVFAYGPPGRGHHYGWYKHHGDDRGDNDDQGEDNGHDR